MPEADPVMRAARNGFLVLIVALLGVGFYEFFLVDSANLVVPALWGLGVAVFYASRRYYRRQEASRSEDDEPTANAPQRE